MAKHKNNHTYNYKGPIEVMGQVVCWNWETTTWAPSEKKAINNLKYRYKRDNNMAPNCKVELPGKLTKEE